MKWMWSKKQFTLVFIPEANNRIVRFKIPKITLYAVPTFTCLFLAAVLATVYLLHSQTVHISISLRSQLAGQRDHLEETISDKNLQIADLQNKVIDLSRQAEQFRKKLDDINELKTKLSEYTGMTNIDPNEIEAGGTTAEAMEGLGRGGEQIPVTEEEMTQLAAQTASEYASLNNEISRLIVSLTGAEQMLKDMQHQFAITPSIWPVHSRSITSGYGVRIDPFTNKPSFHDGIDIEGEMGDPVFATADGTVVLVGRDSLHGNHIIVDHSNGLRTHYMHLNKILVRKYDTVTKGQKIGLVGSTGRSTGPHLHYSVLKNNRTVSPLSYLPPHS